MEIDGHGRKGRKTYRNGMRMDRNGWEGMGKELEGNGGKLP
jgi:hypothetical protein